MPSFFDDFSSGSLANYTQWYPAWGECSISSGVLRFAYGNDVGVYRSDANAPSTNSQYVQGDVAGAIWTNNYVGVAVQMQGQNATRGGYLFRLFDNDSTNKTLALLKVVNGAASTLASTTYATGSAPTMRLECEPSGANIALRCYINGTQITALNYTDTSSPLTGGSVGAIGNETELSIDNLEGGDLAAAATLDQRAYRYFNDDGSESGSTPMASQNVDVTVSPGGVFRVRFGIQATGDPAAAQFRLEYDNVGGSNWRQVP